MIRIKWILDASPSEQSKVGALRKVSLLDRIVSMNSMQSIQKIWTDGEFFFHYKRTSMMRQLRVWTDVELITSIRFWVYADGAAWGLYSDGSTWSKIELTDVSLLPAPSNYSWHGGAYSLFNSFSIVSPARHFWHTYPFHVGHYARIGGRGYYRVQIGPTLYIKEYFSPLITAAVNNIARTQSRDDFDAATYGEISPYPYSVYNPTPWEFSGMGIDSIDGPTLGVPAKTAHTRINGEQVLLSGSPLLFASVCDSGSHLVAPYQVTYEPAPSLFRVHVRKFNYDLSLIHPSAYFQGTYSGFTPPASWNWGTAGHAVKTTINAVSKDGLTLIGTMHPAYVAATPDTDLETGRCFKAVIDPVAETCVGTDLGPVYSTDDTYTLTSTVMDDPLPSNWSWTQTFDGEEKQILHGWGFDADDNIVETTITIEKHTDTVEHASQSISGTVTSFNSDATANVYWKVVVVMDGVMVLNVSTATSYSTYTYTYSLDSASPPAVETTTYTYDYVGPPEVKIHDIDLRTNSFSISIVTPTGTFADQTGNPSTQTLARTFNEYTQIHGTAQTTFTDTSSESIASVSPPVLTPRTYPSHGIAPGSGGTVTVPSSTDFALPVNPFPTTLMGVGFHATGMGYRFINDRDDNTLVYCPTGQEAYWELNGDSSAVPVPDKWHTARPTIFKLYDSSGNEISLTHLGFTDVESLSACDGLILT